MLLHGPSPMQVAIDSAWEFQGLTFPNPAVGAVVVDAHGSMIGVGVHERAGMPHAEVHALQMAYSKLSGESGQLCLSSSAEIHDFLIQNHNDLFKTCSIYVTLEPCAHHGKTPSCANLIKALGLKKVVIGQVDPNAEATGGIALLESAGIEIELQASAEAAALLRPFSTWQKKPYVTYKWAQRLDGSIDGGTISCEASRRQVHTMRDVSDLIVIGGSTVREDRPTLDARLVDGRVCDVLIYSHQKEFDKEIPLFKVQGRKVYIEESLERINSYKNILIEGGPKMFEATKEIVDSYLSFVAPKSGGRVSFATSKEDFDIIHSQTSGSDLMLWMQRKKKYRE